MKDKKITIEQLAGMVQKGFQETAKKSEMYAGFKKVNRRLDKIENILIEKNNQEIKYLKERVTKLEDALVVE